MLAFRQAIVIGPVVLALWAAVGIAAAQQPAYGPQPQYSGPPAAMQPPLAPNPQYLFLAPTNHAYGQTVAARPYAYGWFGACSTPHAVFHWDYYDHRWIWR
ncbi:MAG TPA: hypothetical protein VHX65_07710 [Pirellulales bacterium]|nr:hypothetical protein [Pirellulales bacterium]